MIKQILLGGTVDQGQIWSYSGDANWHEAGNGDWRISYLPTSSGKFKITSMLHIRSGDGNGHSRLYNKARIVKIAPVYNSNLAINSECMFEGTPGYGDQIRFFDCSRTVVAVDDNPSIGQTNIYAVEIMAGDGLHTEISYGSPLILEFHKDTE